MKDAAKPALQYRYQEANACDQRCRTEGHYDKSLFAARL
jgi:hypothetical protein